MAKNVNKSTLGQKVWNATYFLLMFSIGAGAIGITAFGQYQHALMVEGELNYLGIAQIFVAAVLGILLLVGEYEVRIGNKVKGIAFFGAFGLCAALVFLTAMVRVHDVKATDSAKKMSYATAVERATKNLDAAKNELKLAISGDDKVVNGKPQGENWAKGIIARKVECGSKCSAALARAITAREEVAKAEKAVQDAEKLKVEEAKVVIPDWLLPLCIDVLASIFWWAAFSPFMPKSIKKETKVNRKPAQKGVVRTTKALKANKTRKLNKTMKKAANVNSNVFSFPSPANNN